MIQNVAAAVSRINQNVLVVLIRIAAIIKTRLIGGYYYYYYSV